MKFNIRINDLEVRSCGKHLLSKGEHYTAEIVKWSGNTCYTLAYWVRSEEGYDLKYVGNRPFEVEADLFMKLAKKGQKILDEFKIESEECPDEIEYLYDYE